MTRRQFLPIALSWGPIRRFGRFCLASRDSFAAPTLLSAHSRARQLLKLHPESAAGEDPAAESRAPATLAGPAKKAYTTPAPAPWAPDR